MFTSKAALEIILRARDEATKVVGKTSKSFGVLQGAVAGLASGGIMLAGQAVMGLAKGAVQAGGALWDMVQQAAPIEGIGAAFRGVADDADATMSALRKGALGMVSDAELMRQYNQAAQMISKSFADDLPDAMGYLSKVSAATGQDMGYLLDSLTVGVARLSPQILDNLNIQVNAVEANEAYAKSIGKLPEELTKAEQQAALMAQVMDKLEANTSKLPDATGNATTAIAQLKTTFQNVKDQAGLALAPALTALLTPLGDLAVKYGPMVADTFVSIAEHAGTVTGFIGDFLGLLQSNIDPLNAFKYTLAATFGQETSDKVMGFVDRVRGVMETLGPIFAQVWDFVQQVTGQAVAWFQANLPLMQETGRTLVDFFQNHIAPTLDNVWEIIKTVVSTAIAVVQSVITAVMQVITGDWSGAWETIKTAAATVWEAIKTVVGEAVTAVIEAVGSSMSEFKTTWSNNWEAAKKIVATSWDLVKSTIKEKADAIVENVRGFLGNVKAAISGFSLRDAGAQLINGLKNGILSAASGVVEAARGVVSDAIGAAKSLLGIHSPSRVFAEIGINTMKGLSLGLDRGGRLPLAALQSQVEQMMGVARGMTGKGHRYAVWGPGVGGGLGLPIGAGVGGVTIVIHNHFARDSVRSYDDIEWISRKQQEMFDLQGVRTWELH